jgi:hypothetical protein
MDRPNAGEEINEMGNAAWILTLAIVSLIVLDFVAIRFGTDSRHQDSAPNW